MGGIDSKTLALAGSWFAFFSKGIETMMAFITSHCVSVTHEDLAILLREANPLVSALSRVAQDAIQPLGKDCDMGHCSP